MEEKIFSIEWLGRTLTIKTGKLARQATASVTVQYGETVILATVVESKEERDVDFFPLQVDFDEKLYAAGIIKGSRWIKREGRPTDEAILTGRMIDRSIRPLFSGESKKELQVTVTALSVDQKNDHDIVSLIGASAALAFSKVKWAGPIGGIRVGRINGQFIFNPTYDERKESDMDIVVAGTKERVLMIEAESKEIPEDEIENAINSGQKELQPIIELIAKAKKSIGIKEENNILKELSDEEKENENEKNKIYKIAEEWLDKNVKNILFDKIYYTKGERKAAVGAIKDKLDQYLSENNIGADNRKKAINHLVEGKVEYVVTEEILNNKKRVDGRKLDEIRPLSAEVGILPRTHGSALFSRGETQVLSVVTLGSTKQGQTLEGLEGESTKSYIHHYNFQPFSVGEAKGIKTPGRRDIGHGALAEKAVVPILPSKEEFPYTIRVVSETLGSNGSSSMASSCASSLSLMDAGVPTKKAVAGIAMGLASNKDMSKWEILTDIQDLEDGEGGMDFKITGTKDGITAIQLDTKTIGLDEKIIKETLKRGKTARLEILKVMNAVIDKPRSELSPFAPRVTSFHIDINKIGDVIGSGGKVINEIIDEFDVLIDIDDDGLVMVYGKNPIKSEDAVKRIKDIVREIEPGEIFTGKVVRILDFGAFVEFAPNRDGMVHVSKLAPYRVGKPNDLLNVGDEVTVRVEEIDEQGRVNLSMIGLKENEDYWKDEKGKQTSFDGGGFGRPRGGYDRGDRGGRFNKPRNFR